MNQQEMNARNDKTLSPSTVTGNIRLFIAGPSIPRFPILAATVTKYGKLDTVEGNDYHLRPQIYRSGASLNNETEKLGNVESD